jgi:hypothetical protein
MLVDLGSSNGTYSDGHRITETKVPEQTPMTIEFGPGGPRIRLFVGGPAEIAALAPAVLHPGVARGVYVGIAAAVAALVGLALALARC